MSCFGCVGLQVTQCHNQPRLVRQLSFLTTIEAGQARLELVFQMSLPTQDMSQKLYFATGSPSCSLAFDWWDRNGFVSLLSLSLTSLAMRNHSLLGGVILPWKMTPASLSSLFPFPPFIFENDLSFARERSNWPRAAPRAKSSEARTEQDLLPRLKCQERPICTF